MSPAPCAQKRISSLISDHSYSREELTPSLGFWEGKTLVAVVSSTQPRCVHTARRGDCFQEVTIFRNPCSEVG